MNHELNQWPSRFLSELETDSCLGTKELVMRFPINPKEIGREVAERMAYRIVGQARFSDKCIPLEPRR